MRFNFLASPLLALSFSVVPLTSCSAAPAGGKAVNAAGSALTIEDYGEFNDAWAAAFAPGTNVLFVTERSGTMKFVDTATRKTGTVTGLPSVDFGGQGGLGDVAFLPSETSPTLARRTIYLTWAEAGENDTRGAALGRGTLVCEGGDSCRIEGLSVIWRQSPKVSGRGHYSHRILFSSDGQHLYLASGDRQKMEPAQDLSGNLGKVLRLLPDGTPAPGNPLADRGGVTAQVWSYGHRNILGMGWDAQGRLWDIEHGPAGGDELNLVEPGKNYGWPVVSEGDHYGGKKIPRHSTRPDLAAPAISWSPVIGPGDLIFYSGDLFPGWKGQAIIAGLVSQGLVRVTVDGGQAREAGRVDLEKRIREVVQGPDGAIWVLEDDEGGRLRKLTPKR